MRGMQRKNNCRFPSVQVQFTFIIAGCPSNMSGSFEKKEEEKKGRTFKLIMQVEEYCGIVFGNRYWGKVLGGIWINILFLT